MARHKTVLLDINEAYDIYQNSPCDEMLENIIKSGEALVRHFALIYGGGFSYEDLYQTGMLGILKAIKSYDGSTQFSTWGACCIISEIRHFVRRERTYMFPRCIGQEQAEEIIEQTAKDDFEPVCADELAQQPGNTGSSVNEVFRTGLIMFSQIDVSKISSSHLMQFQLPIEDKLALEQALMQLSIMQKTVINALFYRGLTQEQAAQELKINQRQVSRIKQGGIDKLAQLLGSAHT